MSRILVTGGAGFIGSHVVDRLLAAGHEPRIFDLRRSPYHRDVETVIGDVRAFEAVLAAVTGCKAIVHLAAAADVGEVARDPVAAEELNCRGTLSVLHAAREGHVDRVLYASTIWVYSDVEATHVDEETLLPAPSHVYTATKLAGELYCRSYAQLYGVSSTILRFGIPYGPRARPGAVVPTFVGKALAGQPLLLAGGGTQARRFVYVEDLAEGVVRALAPAAANRTFNLVGAEDVTIRQIAETVREVVGSVEVIDVESRPGDFAGAQVSGLRAAEELDWRPQTPFAEGLRRYVEWHCGCAETVTVSAVVAPAATGAVSPGAPGARRPLPWARLIAFAVLGLLVGTLVVERDAVRDLEHVLGGRVLLTLIVAALAFSALALTSARRRRVARS
ncbi:MAG: NAD-dependent epimerase/dehydratase family protein [Solirubrobacteraceae bacterium]